MLSPKLKSCVKQKKVSGDLKLSPKKKEAYTWHIQKVSRCELINIDSARGHKTEITSSQGENNPWICGNRQSRRYGVDILGGWGILSKTENREGVWKIVTKVTGHRP